MRLKFHCKFAYENARFFNSLLMKMHVSSTVDWWKRTFLQQLTDENARFFSSWLMKTHVSSTVCWWKRTFHQHFADENECFLPQQFVMKTHISLTSWFNQSESKNRDRAKKQTIMVIIST